ncbi:MAG: hypothetical protein Q9227_001620 [Pyrenula ochraceoflavens]
MPGNGRAAGEGEEPHSRESIKAEIFNVGKYRRLDTPQPDASFFEPMNAEGERARRAAAEAAVGDLIQWFAQKKGTVAILDATNSTKQRRKWVHERLTAANIEVIFVESKCDDENLIMSNIREVKTTSPDYVGQDPEEAAKDFRNRIRNYEKVYETIDESERDMAYVKLINVGHKVIINLHGESEYNLEGKLGGDANISENGEQYARMLPELVKQSGVPPNTKLTIWTSTLRRTQQTARHLEEQFGWRKLEWKALDELDSGVCDGMTYEEIERHYPEDFKARDEDKYNYRYRGGESYRDVVIRLEPIIMELERSENILIVTHQAIIRCIYAYFMDVPQDRSPWMKVPLHTLMKLTPRAYGTEEQRFPSGIKAVSTYRARGSSAKHEKEPVTETTEITVTNHK